MPGSRELAYLGSEKHLFVSRKLGPGNYHTVCSCGRLPEVTGKHTKVLHTWRKHIEDEARRLGVEL